MCTNKLLDINNWLKSVPSDMNIYDNLILARGNCEKWLQQAKSQLETIRSKSNDPEIKTIDSWTAASKKISSLIQGIKPFNKYKRNLN